MSSHSSLAIASVVLALALTPLALADQHAKPPSGHRGQAGQGHAPSPPAAPPNIVPRGDLRGDIASNARIRNDSAPRPTGFAPRR
ncbi:hypothetical protein [Burkholderia sp. Ac-20379]|uniref:hypothetical protein n=1 Tax=Burkholderia sp. Ac-20379 TaxID=2703900 RepID=UPI001F11E151|nr:hypothetical protein [Burkholderia sp. Ac-20379]